MADVHKELDRAEADQRRSDAALRAEVEAALRRQEAWPRSEAALRDDAALRAEEQAALRRTKDWLRQKARDVMPFVRPTTVAEYARFVVGYLAQGGRIRYVRHRPLSNYYTVQSDLTLPALPAARAIGLLVPEGRTVTMPSGRGQARILYLDGFRLEGGGLEMFSDVAAHLRQT